MPEQKIRAAFEAIHASEHLKAQTRYFLQEKVYSIRQRRRRMMARLSTAMLCICCLLLGAGGAYAYFTPTAIVSIDINPSVELGINRFDHVISVQAFNDDGAALAEQLTVRYNSFADALAQILQHESVAGSLAQNAYLSIVVVGEDEQQNSQLLNFAQEGTSLQLNVHCDLGDTADVKTAHAAGLSCGKYHAGKELMALDATVSAEQLQTMSMREIHDAVQNHHSQHGSADVSASEESCQHGGADHHSDAEDCSQNGKTGEYSGVQIRIRNGEEEIESAQESQVPNSTPEPDADIENPIRELETEMGIAMEENDQSDEAEQTATTESSNQKQGAGHSGGKHHKHNH